MQRFRKLITAMLIVTAFLNQACEKEPIQSEILENDVYGGAASLRMVLFGVLTPGDTLQKIMFENSRNNSRDFYLNEEFMRVDGWMGDETRSFEFSKALMMVKDPFEMPNLDNIYKAIDMKILAELESDAGFDVAQLQHWMYVQASVAAGMPRFITWLYTKKLVISEGLS